MKQSQELQAIVRQALGISDSFEFFRELKKKPENFYIVHYSCQNLNDNNEGLSPRITSIGITHFATEQTVSFSTHAIAEELSITREEVKTRFDEVERKLLEGFYEFIRDRRDKFWLHWNMRNLTYGFEHIEHRYKILGGNNPPVIPVERRINISDMLVGKYGDDFTTHPRMPSLMEMNGGRYRDFLTGDEEVEAFHAGEFLRMHKSTLCKLGFYHKVLKRAQKGRLVTASNGLGVKLDRLFESRMAKLIALVSATAGLMVILIGVWQWLAPYITPTD